MHAICVSSPTIYRTYESSCYYKRVLMLQWRCCTRMYLYVLCILCTHIYSIHSVYSIYTEMAALMWASRCFRWKNYKAVIMLSCCADTLGHRGCGRAHKARDGSRVPSLSPNSRIISSTRDESYFWRLLVSQYLYFCTSKVSKVSTCSSIWSSQSSAVLLAHL
jgi:hypothetical protein